MVDFVLGFLVAYALAGVWVVACSAAARVRDGHGRPTFGELPEALVVALVVALAWPLLVKFIIDEDGQ